ncbi:hypothetical protein TrRE_jg6941, partial [Triparma retinervis]
MRERSVRPGDKGGKSEPWKKIGRGWSTHMVLLSELDGGTGGGKVSGIRTLSSNKSESLLATGSRNGEVLLWDIAAHPPVVKGRFKGHRVAAKGEYYKPERLELYDEGDLKTGEILQLSIEDADRGIVCDGNLTVFDCETLQPLALLKKNSSCHFTAGREEDRVLGLG